MDALTFDQHPSAPTHRLHPSAPSPSCGSSHPPVGPSTNALRFVQSIRAILREKWTVMLGCASARVRSAEERTDREMELIDEAWRGS